MVTGPLLVSNSTVKVAGACSAKDLGSLRVAVCAYAGASVSASAAKAAAAKRRLMMAPGSDDFVENRKISQSRGCSVIADAPRINLRNHAHYDNLTQQL